MSGVYNRKLFRQAPARDELRKLGGIMSSSEELMREALRTADQAPRPAGLGTMAMPMQQPQMPMMQQPMPMQQPMGMMQQPMPMQPQPLPQMMPQQPMMQDPAYMPPQVPSSVQPQGFAAGGMAMGYSLKSEQDTADAAAAAAADPTLDATPADAIQADVLDKAEGLLPRLDTEDPEVIAAEIINTAATKGVEPTGDTQVDLARIYQNLTGDPAAFEKNIDNLNRGIIGAAIGAGTSARATENISKGLLVGLEGAKATEERRLGDTRALQLAEIQARTAEANKRASGIDGAVSRDYRNPVDAFQDAYQAVMNAGEFDLDIPEGMSRQDYAEQVATALIQRSYTPDQLAGSPFEGMSGASAAPPPAAANPAGEDVLNQARAAIAAGADEAAVRERLESLGIDTGSL
jgi:hypothetical protein